MRGITIVLLHLILCPYLFGHEDDAQKFPFIPNDGQWNKNVKYKIELKEAAVFYELDAFHYQFIERTDEHPSFENSADNSKFRGHVLKARFLDYNPDVHISQSDVAPYHYNYFLGNDKSKWRGNVKPVKSIKYKDIYEGIDIRVYEYFSYLKYDYIIKKGSDPKKIRVKYEGANDIKIKNGNLVVYHSVGEFIEQKPYAYQVIGSDTNKIECSYKLKGDELSFVFPKGYDSDYSLIIDPILIFSTYTGSVSDNFGLSGTYDNNGNGYMGGIIFANNYIATAGVIQPNFAGPTQTVDIGLAKIASNGNQLKYATFLGGTSNETVHSMVADQFENIYIFGVSSSSDYPVSTNAYDTTKDSSSTVRTEIINISGGNLRREFRNGPDIVITKLSKNGDQILGSTFYGGDDTDGLNYLASASNGTYSNLNYNYGDSHRGEIVLDSNGFCYIGTSTRSSDLDTSNGTYSGAQDGLIAKFSSNLDSLIWSRYFGGTGKDAIYSLKITPNNKVLIGGGSTSLIDFPGTVGAYQRTLRGGRADGFIALISPDGKNIEYCTAVSTPTYEQVYFIDFDRFNNIYGFGQTNSTEFPEVNSPISKDGGQFFVKFDSTLSNLEMSTLFGGGGKNVVNISPTAFLVDRCQNIYASGWGGSLSPGEGPKTLVSNMDLKDAFRSVTDSNDFYLYVINGTADSLIYASYIGGRSSDDHVDGGTSRFDKNGIIYQSACASCGGIDNDFPRKNAVSNTNRSTNCNNALFKFDFQILPIANFELDKRIFCLNDSTPDSLRTISITNKSVRANREIWDFYGTRVQTSFRDTTIRIDTPGTYFIRQLVEDTVCATGDFKETVIIARPDNINLRLQAKLLHCGDDTTDIRAITNQKANQFNWSKSPNLSNPFVSNDSVLKVGLEPGFNTFYVLAENPITNACEKMDSITIEYVPVAYTASISSDTICENEIVQFNSSFVNIDRFKWEFDNGQSDSINQSGSVNYTQAGNYSISLVVNNNICQDIDTLIFDLNVQINTLQFDNLTDTLFCGKGDFRVTKNTFGTADEFIWSSSRSLTDTLNGNLLDSTFTINSNDSSIYYLKTSNRYCESLDSVLVEYESYELLLEDILDSICSPYSVEINTTIIGSDSFKINYGNGNSTITDSTPLVNYPRKGTYVIELIGGNAKCQIADTLRDTLTILPGVELLPLSNQKVCSASVANLFVNSQGTANRFYWDENIGFTNPINNSSDSTAVVIATDSVKTYYIKAENDLCDAIDSTIIESQKVEVFIEDLLSLCLEDTLELEADVIQPNEQLTFNWQPQSHIISGQGSSKVIIAPLVDISLTLESISNMGCRDLDTIEVEVNNPAFTTAIIFASPDSVYKGQETQLSTNRNGTNLIYQWTPIVGLDNSNSPTPIMTVNTSDSVKVTITDINTGCTVEAFRRIKVFEVNCNEPDIFIPTAFTPNGDQNNDILYVRGANLRSIEFQLFNRWGELIFESTDKNIGWDGKYKGKKVDPDVFTYQLRAICFDGQEYYNKGNITLIR